MSYSIAGSANITLSNTWQLLEAVNPDPSQSSNMATYLNGTLVTTTGGITNTSNRTSNLYINGRGGTSSNSFPGQFGELIIFSNALTAAQRQQVEGYLARKWRLFTSIAAFASPTSIAGCTLWLDAQDSSTITGTSTVTQWRDKSGQGNNTTSYGGTPALTANAINGYQSIYLNGSSRLTGSNSNTNTTATFIIVGTASPNVEQYGCMYSFSRVGVTGYQDTQSMTGPNTYNTGSSRANVAQRNATGGAIAIEPGFNNPFITIVIFDGTNYYGYLNGALMGSNTSSGNFGYTFYAIGAQTWSNPTNYNYFWTGYIGEVIAYNSVLSTAQRQQVETYLANKWGLNTVASFSPTSIPNCLLWFDAADTSKITSTGSTVNSWTSKGSFTGNAISNAGTVTTGLLTQNGKNIITVPASATLSFSLATPNQPRAYFAVARVTSQIAGGTYGAPLFLNCTTSGSGEESFYGPTPQGLTTGYTMGITRQGIADTITTGLFLSPGYRHWAVYSAVNSAISTSSNFITIQGTSQPIVNNFTASGYRTSSFGRTIGGAPVSYDLAELIMINGEVTTTQRQQMEYYLASKWGLLTVPTFEPTVISNCVIWLDAADTDSIVRSGTQVTRWSNKGSGSGYASNASGSGTVTSGTTTYNGLNVVQVPGAAFLNLVATLPNQARAWFAVFKQTSQVSSATSGLYSQYFAIVNQVGGNGQDTVSGPERPTTVGTSTHTMGEGASGVAIRIGTGNTVPSGYNVFRAYTWINSATSTTNNVINVNGTSYALTGENTTAASYSTTSRTYTIGDGGGYGNGSDLAELICINAEITVLQRQQIEYYLSQKWGIAGPPAVSYGPSVSAYGPPVVSLSASVTPALPTAHSFVKIPPSTTLPFFPTNIEGCCLWLDGYDPLGTGKQPSNNTVLTNWVDKSGSNNTMTAINGPTWSYRLPKAGNFVGGVVSFNGSSQYLYKSTPVVSNAHTLFILYRQTSGPGPLYTTTTTTLSNGLFANNGGTTYLTRGDSTWYTASSVFPSNAYNLAVTSYTSVASNVSLYYNGSNVVSTSLSNSITYSNLTIGSRQNAAGNDYFAGIIAEVIAYAGTLTDNQRQRVEGYLAHKYKF
jgi:hypothetical protein